MYAVLLFIHVLTCAALMLVVLLQSGKGGGLAGTFGSAGATTLFGGRGAGSMLSKATAVLGGLFMVTSLTLALLTGTVAKTGGKGILQRARERAGTEQPVSRPGSKLPTGTIPQATSTAPQGQAVAPGQAPQTQQPSQVPPSGKTKTSQTKAGGTGGK